MKRSMAREFGARNGRYGCKLRSLPKHHLKLRKSFDATLGYAFDSSIFKVGYVPMKVKAVCMVQSVATKAHALNVALDNVVYSFHGCWRLRW